jgi:hypothetical protein
MIKTVKIIELGNEIEARLLSEVLTDRNIPHILRSYHDSAYDGLWQTSTAWGFLESEDQFKEEIKALYAEISKEQNFPEEEKEN